MFLPEAWTANTITIIIHTGQSKIGVIGHYSTPGQSTKLNEEFTFFYDKLRSHGHHDIIAAGDFNRNFSDMHKLIQNTNLKTCQN
jgi:hypothetical protein